MSDRLSDFIKQLYDLHVLAMERKRWNDTYFGRAYPCRRSLKESSADEWTRLAEHTDYERSYGYAVRDHGPEPHANVDFRARALEICEEMKKYRFKASDVVKTRYYYYEPSLLYLLIDEGVVKDDRAKSWYDPELTDEDDLVE